MKRLFALCLMPAAALAADPPPLVLEGEIPASAPEIRHFFLDFEVPPGIAEIEIAHDDLSEANILDWGLDAPEGFRGWGGGNRENAVVGVTAASRSYLPGPITPGTWRVVVGKAKVNELPGRYRVEITLRETQTLPPQPERRPYAPAAEVAPGPRWFAGDFHVHSRESGDADPTLDAVAVYAESCGLDFVMLSEHNTTSQLDLYAQAQAAHPALLLVPGAEVTTYAGHFNALGATAFVEHRIGLPDASIAGTAESVHAQGALVSINHPALALGDACIGCAWTHDLAPEHIDAVEIGTGDILKPGGAFNDRAVEFWESLCVAGACPAALGGSDDHGGGQDMGALDSPIGSPTTLVFAESLTVDALLAGVRAGDTVVKLHGPDDPMIDFWPPAADAPRMLHASITGGVGFDARWVRDGVAGERVTIDADPFTLTGTLDAAPGETTRLRVEVLQGNRRRTVTSHRFLVGPPVAPVTPDAGSILPDAVAAVPDAETQAADVGADADPDAAPMKNSLGHEPPAGCGVSARPSTGWPWALLGLSLLRRRGRQIRVQSDVGDASI
jgi:hypothetical protein